MGSTIGSVLQTIGQTGNEAASGQIAGVNQSHQFLMDYLANKARERSLDIQQTGQTGMLDIERQRLEQSRWQMLPGYSKVPDPSDPTNTLYRHTFVDPITKQQSFFDSNSPPPGSTDYIMSQFKDITKQSKDLGLDIPVTTRLSIAGGRMDNEESKNMALKARWDMYQDAAKNDPVARARLNQLYPGGFIDFMHQQTETMPMTAQEWQDYIIREHLAKSGQPTIDPYQKLYEQSLVQSQKTFQALWKSASDNLEKFGEFGKISRPDEYQRAVDAEKLAKDNLDRITSQLNDFYRSSNNPSTPNKPGPNQIVMTPSNPTPPPNTYGTISHTDGHKYYVDKDGNNLGRAD